MSFFRKVFAKYLAKSSREYNGSLSPRYSERNKGDIIFYPYFTFKCIEEFLLKSFTLL